tara:strand:- start:215 stop:709 length:495 start_codon:yes stop_codon:yes gene_type:complete
MKWSEVLSQWESGNYPKVPKNIKSPYFWRTSVQSNKKDLVYKEEFIEDERLLKAKEDLEPFAEHLDKNKVEKYAISFPNLSGDTILVVPMPRKSKKFTNMFYFMNNASEIQKKELWKKVSLEARKFLEKNENIWISTHGLGVNYLHVRICITPKYYENSKLKKI